MKTIESQNKANRANGFLFYCVIIVSVLSQIKELSSFLRPLMYIMWGAVLLYGCIHRKGKIKLTRHTLIFAALYAVLVLVCALATGITGDTYFSGSYFTVMIIPFAIQFIAGAFSDSIEYDQLLRCMKAYVFAAVIYAVYVSITYIPSYTRWLSQIRYAFASKNSAAQIWGIAILFCFLLPRTRSVKYKWVWYGMAAFLLFVSGLCQCRASLLALAVCALLYIITSSKHKLRWLILTALLVTVILMIPAARRYLDKAFLVSRYSGQGINAFSSGRLDGVYRALRTFRANPVVGNGSYYFDCSYVMILAEYGILGFILIEGIWISRIVFNFRFKAAGADSIPWKRMIFAMTVFYIVESLLEGLPPFGPGVCSFMFWLICGMVVDNPELIDTERITVAE